MITQNEKTAYKWWLILSIVGDTLILLLCFSLFFLPLFSCDMGDATKNISVLSLMTTWGKTFSFSHVAKDATLIILILTVCLLTLSMPLIIYIFVTNVKNLLRLFSFNSLTDNQIDSGLDNIKMPSFSYTLGLHITSVILIGSCSLVQRLYPERFAWSLTFIDGVSWWILIPIVLLIPYYIVLSFIKRHYNSWESYWLNE